MTDAFTPYFEGLEAQGVQTAFTAQSHGVAALAVMFVIGLSCSSWRCAAKSRPLRKPGATPPPALFLRRNHKYYNVFTISHEILYNFAV